MVVGDTIPVDEPGVRSGTDLTDWLIVLVVNYNYNKVS